MCNGSSEFAGQSVYSIKVKILGAARARNSWRFAVEQIDED